MAAAGKRQRGISPPPAALAPSSSSAYFLPELIPLVARRLTSLQDFFALRATCRTYRALLPPSPSNLAAQAPHLLLTDVDADADADSLSLLHLPLRRLLRFRLPSTRRSRFYSLGCGRVAIAKLRSNRQPIRRDLRIVHLLTGELSRLPNSPESFYRFLLSGDLVLACNPHDRVIHYCRIGDTRWSVASCGEAYRLQNLVFVKGIIYALVTPGYRLAVIELSDNSSMELKFLGGELGAQAVHEDELDAQPVKKSAFFSLAECHGELLLISGVEYFPRAYHVFQWQSGEGKWARMTSLGRCTLFFTNDDFVGCLGPDHPGIRRDSIYFTWDSGKWSKYYLPDGLFDEFDATVRHGTPVWVFPGMC